MNEQIKFSHFRKHDAAGFATKGGATIAYKPVADKLLAAIAYCSPRDNFSYAAGRLKASARLTYLLEHPEHAGKEKAADKYFVIPIIDGRIAPAVDRLRDHLVDGLGYAPRYEQKAQASAQA